MKLSKVREENIKTWDEEDLNFYEDFLEGLPEKEDKNSPDDDTFFEEAWSDFKNFLNNEK